ncbi:hypothetical protein QBC47DRAFT_391158, partial [Echria macrotheca]
MRTWRTWRVEKGLLFFQRERCDDADAMLVQGSCVFLLILLILLSGFVCLSACLKVGLDCTAFSMGLPSLCVLYVYMYVS